RSSPGPPAPWASRWSSGAPEEPLMAKHGKRYLQSRDLIDREREYEPAEAVGLIKAIEHAKFDESVELHVRAGLNVRHADETLRGTIALPNGLGKNGAIAVLAQGDKGREGEEAGRHTRGRG